MTRILSQVGEEVLLVIDKNTTQVGEEVLLVTDKNTISGR